MDVTEIMLSKYP